MNIRIGYSLYGYYRFEIWMVDKTKKEERMKKIIKKLMRKKIQRNIKMKEMRTIQKKEGEGEIDVKVSK